MHRTAADASHAMRTICAPRRPAILKPDIMQHAVSCAFPTAYACIRCIKRRRPDREAVKHCIDRIGFEPVHHPCFMRWEALPPSDACNTGLDIRTRRFNDLLCLRLPRCPEQHNIIFRHNDLQYTFILERLFFAQLGNPASGAADLAATGQDKIRFTAARKVASLHKFRKNMRQLPAVGGCNKNPRPVRL